MCKKQSRIGERLRLFFVCTIITPVLILGCSYLNDGLQARSIFQEANDFFSQGDYEASLHKYEQIIEKHPTARDRILFEMGIIYAYPRNEQKDYQKSLECFQELIKDYPESEYRRDSEMMIFNINNVIIKDKTIATQKTQIETLQQELKSKENGIVTLQKKIEVLEQKIFALRKEPADKILIEKKNDV